MSRDDRPPAAGPRGSLRSRASEAAAGPAGARPAESRAAIRAAGSADLDALAALDASCFGGAAWSRRQLADELEAPGGLLLVATGGDAARPLAGYAAFRRAAGEAELLRVAVAPAARRRGLGAALMDAGLGRLRAEGATACFLEVEAGNRAALALYATLGFRPVGRRRGYYPGGGDALLLRADLAPAAGPG
jgi:ribosomal-protein-alanine N-acetyltransferase